MQLFICQYCESIRKNNNSLINHERTCPSNENRKYYNYMTGKKGVNQYTKAKALGLDAPKYDTSKRTLNGCVTWDRDTWYSQVKGRVGGYRENAGRSKKYRVLDSFGKETVLQSSYELKCSEILNELSISWYRPKAMKYSGKNYFADFYLPDFDIYLDPKNDYKAKCDAEKIASVIDQNKVKLYVLLLEQLTPEYIIELVSPNGEGLN